MQLAKNPLTGSMHKLCAVFMRITMKSSIFIQPVTTSEV